MTAGPARVATPRPRAPFVHHVLAVCLGAVLVVVVALVVGASNADDFWAAAGIGALCTVYPALSLGYRVFVTRHTVTRDAHGSESVELVWMREAGAGAFVDVVVAALVVAAVLVVTRADVDALPVVLALVGLAAADAAIRYAVVRRR